MLFKLVQNGRDMGRRRGLCCLTNSNNTTLILFGVVCHSYMRTLVCNPSFELKVLQKNEILSAEKISKINFTFFNLTFGLVFVLLCRSSLCEIRSFVEIDLRFLHLLLMRSMFASTILLIFSVLKNTISSSYIDHLSHHLHLMALIF